MGQVFRRVEQYLDQLDPGCFIEIGSSRGGDSSSTEVIASWANRRKERFITVDIDPDQSNRVIRLKLDNVSVINTTGEEFLQSLPRPGLDSIAFLYLDNFDWDWQPGEPPNPDIVNQQARYREFGLEMNNINSQRAHLAQMMLAMPLMAPRSIVACDDTWYNKWWGHFSGKSGSVVPYLLNNGYEVLYTEEQSQYGTILGRGIK